MVDEQPVTPLAAADAERRVNELIGSDGRTFAEQAGIELADEPGPLWQLLVLTNLLSNRIRSDTAIASAHELWKVGCTTPAGTRTTSWQQRVDALGRGGYRRYDFSTSTRLGKNAALVRERWGDDLRTLHHDAADGGDTPGGREGRARPASASSTSSTSARIAALLQEFDGIGPAGARIFLREVQGVWPDVAPVVDPLVQRGARTAGLPEDAAALESLAGADLTRLCAALVRLAKKR